ncbi:Rha family transcriptional regulator [Fructilactobacillus sp. Tb1]|uniref:Rha family transcriptional regulator n=1 Tax=Fructilactobacillus sp. Tb1 TaxID=3422304 RepID=UPI003D29AC33
MEELVKLSDKSINGVPYTTADVLADYVGLEHRSVNRLISNNIDGLEFFGVLRFEIAKVPNGRPRKIWILNEQQSTYLITLFKNNKKIKKLKRILVHEFYVLKNQQTQRQMIHDFSKEISNQFNKAIKDNVADTKSYDYSNFNRLVYKTAIGMGTSTLKKLRQIPSNTEITTFLTIDEFKAVNRVKAKVVTLLYQGLNYQEIKNNLNNAKMTITA